MRERDSQTDRRTDSEKERERERERGGGWEGQRRSCSKVCMISVFRSIVN